MNVDLIEKLKKLMRLADPSRGATEGEIAAAQEKIAELLAKNGLEASDINLEEKRAEGFNINKENVNMSRGEYHVDTYVARILVKAFNIKVLFSSRYDGTKKRLTFIFVGTPEDIAIAKEIHPFFEDQLNSGLRAFLKMRGLKWSAACARGYFSGFVKGFLEANAVGRAKAYAAASQANRDAYAIVLVDKEKAIAAFIEQNMNVRTAKPKTHTVDYYAKQAGFANGATVALPGSTLK